MAKSAEVIKMTREQQLEMENITLKLANAQQELARLQDSRIALQKTIFADAGVSWASAQGWIVNVLDGIIARPTISPHNDAEAV